MDRRLFRPAFAVLATLALVSGCGWLGGTEEEKLPGERISIMVGVEDLIQADSSISELEVVLPPAERNANWAQAGGNEPHALQHLALGAQPSRAWRADVGSGNSSDAQLLAQPVIVDGVVYTMDSRSTVSAFDASSGKRRWRVDLEPEDEDDGYFGGGIAWADGRLYVTTGFAQVFALNASDGSVIWQTPVPAPMRAAPTVAAGRVYVVTLDNQVRGLDAETGTNLWDQSGIEEIAGLIGMANPAVSGSSVIVPYSSGEFFALLAENGRLLWEQSLASSRRTDQTEDIAQIRGLPVVDRDLVFAVGHSGRMTAVDLRRGARAWEVEIGGTQMPWVAGEFIFVISNEQQLVALTRLDGRVRWVTDLPRFEDPEDLEDPIHWFGPVLAGERLIVASSTSKVKAISPFDGSIQWEKSLAGAATMTPVVADATLYFLTENGTLLAWR